MRRPVKRWAERLALFSGVHRWGARGSSVILAYHNIVPEGEPPVGDRSLHLAQRDFAAQLDALLESHDVVSLEEIVAPRTPAARGRAAITFDDAYRGTLTAGCEEVRRRGVPATVFVPPGCLGDQSFWWDELADPTTGTLDKGMRAHALGVLGGVGDRIRAWARGRGASVQVMPAFARSGTELELAEAVAGGLAVASHTWSHVNLAAVDAAAGREELERASGWLAERFPGHPAWLAYPYGAAPPGAAELARTTGHQKAVLVAGGPFRPAAPPDQYLLPRVNVPGGVSVDGFRLRLAGLVA